MFGSVRLWKHSARLVETLLASDCVLVVLLFYTITLLTGVPWTHYYTYLSFAVLPISLIVFYSFDLYQPMPTGVSYKELIIIIRSWIFLIGLILLIMFTTKASEAFSRKVLLIWFTTTPFIIFTVHIMYRKLLKEIRIRGHNIRKAVIIGAGDIGIKFYRYLDRVRWLGIEVVGFFDDRKAPDDLDGDLPGILGTIKDLPRFMKQVDLDYIYIALPLRAEHKIQFIINETRSMGAKILLIPDLFAYNVFNTEFQSLGEDILLISFNPSNRAKRYFDILFSFCVLLFTLPVFAIISLAIKLCDRGPVFYGHSRITVAGKGFNCWKFRTMCVDSDKKLKTLLEQDPRVREEWEKTFKLKIDPRVTWIGRILRKTSLDELPQFFNVLKGDMSVVGARPIVRKELQEYYKDASGLYCSIKPGITGPWQITKRSDTQDYNERVQLDCWYVMNRSFWIDIKIIFKTILSMFNGKGAY